MLRAGPARVAHRSSQIELPLYGRAVPAEAVRPSPLSVGIREACRLTGISRSKLYLCIAAGELVTFKVGSRTLIAWRDLEDFIARCRKP